MSAAPYDRNGLLRELADKLDDWPMTEWSSPLIRSVINLIDLASNTPPLITEPVGRGRVQLSLIRNGAS